MREGSTFTPPDYGRFGMTRHRFQAISKCFRLSDFDEGIVEEVGISELIITNHCIICILLLLIRFSVGSMDSNSSIHRCFQ